MSVRLSAAFVSAAFLGLVALGGCKPAAESGAPTAPASKAAETDAALTDARLVLPAVKGNPGAAYFTVNNKTTGTMAIASVAIDGAGKAEVHQTMGTEMTPVDRIDIAPGTSITFEPGKLHVMVFDIAPTLKPGGSTNVTVNFADGSKMSATMPVASAGDAAMAGMDHGGMH